MPRNRVQHQKGLSDDGFEQRYPDEEACRKAWFAAHVRAFAYFGGAARQTSATI
jgi:hypothetical protein